MSESRKILVHSLRFSVWWILALLISTSFPAVPTYTLKKAPQTIAIDGVLNEQLWSKLDSFSLVDCASGLALAQGTRVKAAWDAQNIYLAISARDKDVWATIAAHDGNLYTEEMLEFFIDPDRDGKNYFEYEFNCLNALMDMFMSAPYGAAGGGGNISWTSSNINYKVKVHGTINDPNDIDTDFVLEARIPWADLKFNAVASPQPKVGDRMSVNVYRGDGRQTKAYSCWSPVGGSLPGSFHSPQLFGAFVFSDSPAYSPSDVLAPSSNSAAIAGCDIRCNSTRSGVTIATTAPENAEGAVCISSMLGKTLVRFPLQGGRHSIVVGSGQKVSPGIYFIRLQTKQGNAIRKAVF
jgi:hypothetical protein